MELPPTAVPRVVAGDHLTRYTVEPGRLAGLAITAAVVNDGEPVWYPTKGDVLRRRDG